MSIANSFAKKRRAPIEQAPVSNQTQYNPNAFRNGPAPATNGSAPAQSGFTLPQVIALIDKRLVTIERQVIDLKDTLPPGDSPMYSEQFAQDKVSVEDFQTVLKEFNDRFEMLADEFANYKNSMMTLQSFTMEVNQKLVKQLEVANSRACKCVSTCGGAPSTVRDIQSQPTVRDVQVKPVVQSAVRDLQSPSTVQPVVRDVQSQPVVRDVQVKSVVRDFQSPPVVRDNWYQTPTDITEEQYDMLPPPTPSRRSAPFLRLPERVAPAPVRSIVEEYDLEYERKIRTGFAREDSAAIAPEGRYPSTYSVGLPEEYDDVASTPNPFSYFSSDKFATPQLAAPMLRQKEFVPAQEWFDPSYHEQRINATQSIVMDIDDIDAMDTEDTYSDEQHKISRVAEEYGCGIRSIAEDNHVQGTDSDERRRSSSEYESTYQTPVKKTDTFPSVSTHGESKAPRKKPAAEQRVEVVETISISAPPPPQPQPTPKNSNSNHKRNSNPRKFVLDDTKKTE